MGRCGPSCSPYNGLLRWTFLLLVFGSSLSQAGTVHRQDDEPVTYTDQWAVHIEGGQQVADEIARRNDFINLGKVRVDYSFLLTVFCFLVFHENVWQRRSLVHSYRCSQVFTFFDWSTLKS